MRWRRKLYYNRDDDGTGRRTATCSGASSGHRCVVIPGRCGGGGGDREYRGERVD